MSPRDPADCDVVILPVIRKLNAPAPIPYCDMEVMWP